MPRSFGTWPRYWFWHALFTWWECSFTWWECSFTWWECSFHVMGMLFSRDGNALFMWWECCFTWWDSFGWRTKHKQNLSYSLDNYHFGVSSIDPEITATGSCISLFQEYDIVFNVDIEEGKPPLKLPFNLTGKPMMWTRSAQLCEVLWRK